MSFLRAKPIGVMPMIDQGEQDDKIIAVHADDPEFKGYSDISELPKHRLMEIKRCAWLSPTPLMSRNLSRWVINPHDSRLENELKANWFKAKFKFQVHF